MAQAQTLTGSYLEIPHIRHIPVKRLFDLVFSLSVLLIGAPVYLFIALAICLTSKGRPIYAQRRIGRGGKPFACYKFRSMYRDADERLQSLLDENLEFKREWERDRKLKNDPRVTPLGAFLRKTSLDELPQFFNVFKGDISVVGPRPVVKEEVELYMGPAAGKILSIRPGVTGLWQVSGRNNTTYQERLDLEQRYVRERSFWMDLKIIIKTLPVMLSSKGAY